MDSTSLIDPIPSHLLEKLFQTQPERISLDNGMEVLFQEDHGNPLLSVQAWVKTGSVNEGDLIGSGLSHYLEHILFKGTDKRSTGAIAEEVQTLGANINAYTAFDRTVYYIDGPATAADAFFDLLSDMLFHSKLDEEEVTKEKDVILREIDMGLDDPDRTVSRKTLAVAFRNHPYRYPVIGYRDNFEKVTREQLYNYYKARYIPNNIVLTISGGISKDEAESLLQKYFVPEKRKPLVRIPIEPEPEQLAMRHLQEYGDFQVCRGAIAFKIPSMRHVDAPGLDVMAAVLGSGYSGYLRQQLRDKQKLVHSIGAASWNPGSSGLFWISFQCDPDKANRVSDAILECLHTFADQGPSLESLNKAKRFALVSEMQSRQTVSGVASRLGLIEAVVGDPHYPEEYFSRLQQIDVDAIKRLAKTYFVSHKLTKYTLNSESEKPKAKERVYQEALPPFQERRLSNGARIIFQRDERLPRVSMRFAALGGPTFEDPDWRGATALLATMLTKDTLYRCDEEVSNSLESTGGFMTETSGNNSFSVSLDFIPGDERLALRTFEEALLYPAFNEDTLECEKANQIASIRESMDEVLDYGKRILRQNFFASHSFSSDPLGDESSVNNLNADVLRALYLRLMVGENAVISLCGDFDPDVFIPKIEAILCQFSSLPLRKAFNSFSGPIQPGDFQEILPREQAVVFDSFPDCGVADHDYIKGELLDEILSDMSGPLFVNVREKQSLAYYVGATRLLGLTYGMFTLYAGTAPNSQAAVQSVFDKEIDRIRSGNLTTEEIARAKTRLKVQKTTGLQTLRSRAAQTTQNALYQKPVEDWLEYPKQIDAITPEDLKRFSIKYLDPAKRVRLVVTPN